ncbi:MAG: class I SAM-dependent methyltransferase [Bacteroidales bacterium]
MASNFFTPQVSGLFYRPNYYTLVSNVDLNKIRAIEYFQNSQYSGLKMAETLEFYTKRYVQQLFDFKDVNSNTVIADIGAGFGWLSMAFVFSTEAKVIAVDPNKERLDAAQEIAEILGVRDRIDWRVGRLGSLPLDDKEAEVVYCIEVLEHVYRDRKAIPDLCRVSADLLILTTPNLWFPVIAHDTRLPFCHWLPVSLRKPYAKLFKRENEENDNLFWSPLSLRKYMNGYKPVSKWLHYSSLKRFKETYPFYLPYGNGLYVEKIGFFKNMYYEIISKLGMYSHYLSPSLSYVFRRKN